MNKILVVDDDANLRLTLCDILRVKGFEPVEAKTGRDALRRAAGEDFDAAIIDLRLEDVSGLEVLRGIKQASPHTECILLTGHASQETAIEAVNAGGYAYLQKPFDQEQLLVILRRAVEKRAAVRALAESRALYRTFLDASEDIAFLKDENFRYIICNQANARFLGRPIEEIVGRDDFELMPPQAAEGCRRSDRQALEEGRPVTSLEVVAGRFYETRKFPVPLGGGRIGVGGYARDVTERKQAEAQLLLQNAALEASANAIVIANREGFIEWANPAFTALTGYQVPDEVFGRNPRDLLKSGKQDQRFYKDLWDTILSGKVWRGTLINRRKDGTLYDEEMTITPVRGEDDEIAHFIAVKQDITQRKVWERELLESERHYAALVEVSPAGIFRTDVQGATTYVSPRWCEISGLSAEAALGSGWLETVHPEDRPALTAGWQAAVEKAQISTAQYRFVHPDGSIRWVMGQAMPELDEQGRLSGYVGAILDITAQRAAEESLRASEARYRGLFEDSPVSLWEEDFSQVKERLEALRRRGVKDFDAYLRAHPEVVDECAALVRVLDVNRATLRMYGAASKEELLTNLSAILGGEGREQFRRELVSIASGVAAFTWEGVNYTLSGERREVSVRWSAAPGHEERLERVLVSIVDITQRKHHERQLEAQAMLAQALGESLELQPLLERLLEAARHAIPAAEKGAILLLETDGRLRVRALNGYSDPRLKEFTFASDSGYSAHAARERRPLLIPDARADPKIRYDGEIEEARQIHGAIAVPLLIQERVIGVLSLDSTQKEAFTQEDLNHLTSFASSAALIIENARLFEETRRRADELATLYESAQALAAKTSLEEVLQAITQSISRLFGATGVGLYLYDPLSETLEVKLAPHGTISIGTRLTLGEGLAGKVAQSRRVMRIDNYMRWEGRSPKYDGIPIRAVMEAPLIYQDRLVGVLVVHEAGESERKFTEADERLLSLFAVQAAAVIQNVRLFEETRRRAEQIAAVNALGRALSVTLDLPALYRIAYEQVRGLLDCDNFGISLYDETTRTLRATFVLSDGQELDTSLLAPLVLDPQQPHEGRLGAVLEAEPIIVNDLVEKRRQSGGLLIGNEHEPQSAAYVPMVVKNHVIGLLELQSYRNHAYQEEELDLMRMIANQIGLAIQNARLFEEIQTRLQELEILQSISSALRQARTVEEMLPFFIQRASRAVKAAAGSIYLWEEASGAWVSQGWMTSDGHWLTNTAGLRHPRGEGITGWVGEHGEIYITADWRADLINRKLPQEREFLQHLTGGISLPLKAEARIIGVMHLWYAEAHEFNEEEKRLLTAIADMAGNSIQRARLHQETQRRLEQLQSLQIIDQAITSSLDPRVSLNILLEHTLHHLGGDAGGVLLLNPILYALEYAAARGFRSLHYKRSSLHLGQGELRRELLAHHLVVIPDLSREPSIGRRELIKAEGFVSQVIAPLVVKGQLKGALEIFYRTPYSPTAEQLNFFEGLARQAAIAIDNGQLFENLQRANLELSLAYDETIEGWSRALDLRDKETEGHTQRVTDLTLKLAQAMDVSPADLVHIRRGALLHDIGKMGIPDSILFKEGPLTAEEWALMRQHPQFAYDMLAPIEYLHPALDIPWCHHEKWDGTGYPRGLQGEQIPLAARIFAVADVWDALTSDRPYRKAWSQQEALEYIQKEAGNSFDPQVIQVFLNILPDLYPSLEQGKLNED